MAPVKDGSTEVRVVSKEQVGEEGRLFQGIGPVSEHYPLNPVAKALSDFTGDGEHVRWLEIRAGYSFQVK